jgi:hypothetical protein
MPFRNVLGVVRAWFPGPGEPARPPVDPGYGVEAPVYPDQGLPGAPVYPDQGLPGGGYPGRPSHPIARPPHPGGKPPGIPILPVDPDWGIPVGPPSFPGDWHPVDPGYGLPPIWGFIPVDPGFGVPLPGAPDQGLPTPPDGGAPGQGLPIPPSQPGVPTQPLPIPPTQPPGTPTQPLPTPPGRPSHPIAPGGGGAHPGQLPGHWVPVRPPVDPGYGVEECDCEGEAQPKWAWIPEVGPTFGIRYKKPKHR